jgi:hypothetical protein
MGSKAPHKAGDRVAVMPNGYSLVPGIVLSAWQGDIGKWRGDIRTADGVLENRPLHPDFVVKASSLQETTRNAWSTSWERLEKDA